MNQTSPKLRAAAPSAIRPVQGPEGFRQALAEAPGLPLSFLFHVVLAVLLVLAARAAIQPQPVVEKSLAVDILTPEQFAALAPAEEPSPEAPADVPAPSRDTPAPSETIRPTRMLSGAALADPRSREARETLPQLESDERMIQICGLEAMEQVHSWRPDFRPDALVAYALSDPTIAGDRIHANGAAFRSEGSWYEISFDCAVSPDHMQVQSFSFRVGDPVPQEEWEAHNLTTKS